MQSSPSTILQMPLLISEIISNKNGQQRSAGRFFTPNNGKIFCKDGNERFMRDVRACKVMFGAEPTDKEVMEFINYQRMIIEKV